MSPTVLYKLIAKMEIDTESYQVLCWNCNAIKRIENREGITSDNLSAVHYYEETKREVDW